MGGLFSIFITYKFLQHSRSSCWRNNSNALLEIINNAKHYWKFWHWYHVTIKRKSLKLHWMNILPFWNEISFEKSFWQVFLKSALYVTKSPPPPSSRMFGEKFKQMSTFFYPRTPQRCGNAPGSLTWSSKNSTIACFFMIFEF